MGESSGKGSSLVAISQRRTAKLHMSEARVLISEGDFNRDSGEDHCGWWCLPRSWKEKRASAMLIRATTSSSDT